MKFILPLLMVFALASCSPHPAAKSGTQTCPGGLFPEKGSSHHRGRVRKTFFQVKEPGDPKKD